MQKEALWENWTCSRVALVGCKSGNLETTCVSSCLFDLPISLENCKIWLLAYSIYQKRSTPSWSYNCSKQRRDFSGGKKLLMTSWAVVCDVWYQEPQNLKLRETPIEFAERCKKAIRRTHLVSALLLHFTFEEDCFPMDDACKPSQGFSNPIFTRVMSVVMGIVTMVHLTGNMPRKLTDATLYSSSMCCVDETTKGQFHVSC
ncbi:hypothetical protein F0562_003319 [Nyssa sinensis]|uniref:Uncharacterized protein n=1 Tax=Nyssa sinensis TaxID=561372 RepID=A0A5J5BY57_9ASTE|nr:hypothetical protein F0562_003319 [Nyssa sinensis]